MRYATGLLLLFACWEAFAAQPGQGQGQGQGQRTLTFEDRVKAQEAIERVYYSHQLGATKSFEEAVSRTVLEAKVHKYLDETAALRVYWKTEVTDEMLQRELERMASGTRMPERLLELYAALGNDSFVIKECLARATLVDRLAHNFYSFDPTLQVAARRRLEDLRRQLSSGELSPAADHPDRSVVELVVTDTTASESMVTARERRDPTPGRPLRLDLSSDEFRKQRAELPERVGHISAVKEERDGFILGVVLSETKREALVASYLVSKIDWDAWWSTATRTLNGDSSVSVADDGDPLPVPTASRSASVGLDASGVTCAADDTWDNGAMKAPPDGREGLTSVWTGNVMVVWGGCNLSNCQNTGGRYDPATDVWSPTSTTGAPSRRGGHTAVWTGSSMVIWGGNDANGDSSGGRYDPTTDTWTPTSTTGAPTARSNHTAVWTGSRMVVWGGWDGRNGNYLNTGGRYDPATDSWSPTSTTGAPSARADQAAVWTGSLMVVWGGANADRVITGGRYDPQLDLWTATSTSGVPVGRDRFTAVWTGTQMLVWGGFVFNAGDGNTGGRYDPATDTWTPTATIGAPAGRSEHSAVWTGSLMVVWGGRTNMNLPILDTGGRYDPASDSWTPTSTTAAPTARYNHTAVWTGRSMVVWGGLGSGVVGAYPNAGGRYDPTSDRWTPTATAGAPVGRWNHTAVWTGSQMVVWGGFFGSDPYSRYFSNTGGRYDPATDSWASTSTAMAPAPREWHSAVWTGSSMVIWGGFGDQYLNTGGRYDPVSDSWTPTATTGAPTGRYSPSAVWTGSLMVIFGGNDGSNNPSPGGGTTRRRTSGRQYPRPVLPSDAICIRRCGQGAGWWFGGAIRRRPGRPIRVDGTTRSATVGYRRPRWGHLLHHTDTRRYGPGRRCWCGAEQWASRVKPSRQTPVDAMTR